MQPGLAMRPLHESHSVEDRLHKVNFGAPVSVHELLPAVVVAEVAIEPNLWKSLGNLHRSPHVLRDGRAVRLDEDRKAMLDRRIENGFNQAIYLVSVFQPPARVKRQALIAAMCMLLTDGVRLDRSVNTIQAAEAKKGS